MSGKVEQKVEQIQLSEIERLKLENIELKKRSLEQQYNALEEQKRGVIGVFCKTHNCKIESVGMIDLDSGIVSIK